jgi:hypothetical protein
MSRKMAENSMGNRNLYNTVMNGERSMSDVTSFRPCYCIHQKSQIIEDARTGANFTAQQIHSFAGAIGLIGISFTPYSVELSSVSIVRISAHSTCTLLRNRMKKRPQ